MLSGGCRDGDSPSGPRTGGVRLFITSEPSGARIVVDGDDTGQLTPDTVAGFTGTHDIQVRLDTAGVTYEYNVRVAVSTDDTASVPELHGPLSRQCPFAVDQSECYVRLHAYTTGAGIRYAHNPLGSLFLHDGTGNGALWPSTTSNSYVSGGIPVFAALANETPVSLGVYDHAYLAGRPAPVSSAAAGRATLRQSAWIVPPTLQHLTIRTTRGIEVREEIVTSETVSGVVLVKLTFRNITALPEYRAADPFLPAAGLTFTNAFIGLALDPDIGDAEDDLLSYDAALDMVFAYDARFAENGFGGGAATAPGLVGLRVLRAPAGTTVMLNGWDGDSDWTAGTGSEGVGFAVLSGQAAFAPAHEHPRIGHVPENDGDMRLSVTAGPLTLAPGEQAEIVVAIAFAAPAAGTYQSGTEVLPGDPVDVNRALYRIAAELRERMVAATGLLN